MALCYKDRNYQPCKIFMPFTFGGDYISSIDDLPPKKQQALSIKKEKRKNKTVIIICHVNPPDQKELTKKLKMHLACGGTTKDNMIELQTDNIEKVKDFLSKKGFKINAS